MKKKQVSLRVNCCTRTYTHIHFMAKHICLSCVLEGSKGQGDGDRRSKQRISELRGSHFVGKVKMMLGLHETLDVCAIGFSTNTELAILAILA